MNTVPMAAPHVAAIDLNQPGTYLHWSIFEISVANLVVIAVMVVIFGAALLIFVDCLKELPATLLLRPLNVETLATYIYQFATRGRFEQGSLAALIIVAVGILPVIRITRYADIATRLRLDTRS